MKRLGLYFSGTGNSAFCVTQFIRELDGQYRICSLEDVNAKELIKEADEIIVGYPIYYSNIPMFIKDFVTQNSDLWKQKKIFLIATMGLFSGDGSGCLARLLKKHGGIILGGIHLKMPDCIIDVAILKKNDLEEQRLIDKAVLKIKQSAQLYKNSTPPQQGLHFFSHMLGLFGQRLWFLKKTSSYQDAPKINDKKCIKCKECINVCPMHNLSTAIDGSIINSSQCTLCYRCVHTCPKQAITILGKKVIHSPSSLLKSNDNNQKKIVKQVFMFTLSSFRLEYRYRFVRCLSPISVFITILVICPYFDISTQP